MENYRKQRNYVVNLNNKAKRSFFNNVIPQDTKSKNFWEACKPLFSTNSYTGEERILIVEDNNIITNNRNTATIFNEYFNNITRDLNIPILSNTSSLSDPVLNATEKYSNHPSILKIKEQNQIPINFEFSDILPEDTMKIIMDPNKSKKTSGGIPSSILQLAANVIEKNISESINMSIRQCIFPDKPKTAHIIQCHKKR